MKELSRGGIPDTRRRPFRATWLSQCALVSRSLLGSDVAPVKGSSGSGATRRGAARSGTCARRAGFVRRKDDRQLGLPAASHDRSAKAAPVGTQTDAHLKPVLPDRRDGAGNLLEGAGRYVSVSGWEYRGEEVVVAAGLEKGRACRRSGRGRTALADAVGWVVVGVESSGISSDCSGSLWSQGSRRSRPALRGRIS